MYLIVAFNFEDVCVLKFDERTTYTEILRDVTRVKSDRERRSRGTTASHGLRGLQGDEEDEDGSEPRGGGERGGQERRRGDTRNFVIAFQTTLCTLMDSSNQLITVMTRVHQFALIF